MDYRRMMTRGFTPEARAAWSPCDPHQPREFRDGHPWHPLSEYERAAMIEAPGLCVHLNTVTMRSGIDCGLPHGARPQSIPVPGRVWHRDSDAGSDLSPRVGFVVLFRYGVAEELSTTLAALLPGDQLRLLWWPDARTTDALARVGFHHDMLRLEVRRHDRLLVFCLTDRVCDDERARLIRRIDPVLDRHLLRRST